MSQHASIPTRRRLPLIAFGLLVGFAVVVGASLAGPPRTDPEASDAFWTHLFVNSVSPGYESMEDMLRSSEAVVLGRMGELKESRSWVVVPEWGSDGIAFYAVSSIKVEQVIRGNYVSSTPGTLDLELFVPVPVEFAEFKAAQPAERSILFLYRKQDSNTPVYGIVSPNRGYVRDFGAAEPPIGADDEWFLRVRDLSFDGLVRQLKAASARS